MNEREYLERPDKQAMRSFPPFRGLPLQAVVLLKTTDQVHAAEQELAKAQQVGFDTESKPVFLANQPKTGPHLIQIATEHRAFLFPFDFAPGLDLVRRVLTSDIAKAGFGLKGD